MTWLKPLETMRFVVTEYKRSPAAFLKRVCECHLALVADGHDLVPLASPAGVKWFILREELFPLFERLIGQGIVPDAGGDPVFLHHLKARHTVVREYLSAQVAAAIAELPSSDQVVVRSRVVLQIEADDADDVH